MKRFYLSPDDWREPFELRGQEAGHLSKVLRAREGDEVAIFDGQGREGLCTVTSVGKNRCGLSLVSERMHPRPQRRVHLAVAWTKSTRRGWFLEKSVELDAASILFWQSDRTQGKVPAEPKPSWEGPLVAGAKQCGNPWLPELHTIPGGARELAGRIAGYDAAYLLYEGEDQAGVTAASLRGKGDVLYIVGPEGGFTDEEAATLLQSGAKAVTLGPRIFRWETAALVCLGLNWWGSYGAQVD